MPDNSSRATTELVDLRATVADQSVVPLSNIFMNTRCFSPWPFE